MHKGTFAKFTSSHLRIADDHELIKIKFNFLLKAVKISVILWITCKCLANRGILTCKCLVDVVTVKWCWLGSDDHTAKGSLVFIPETRLLDLSWDKSPLIKWLHTNRVHSLSLCCTYSYLIIFNDTWHHLTMNVHNPKVTWLLPQQFIFPLSRNFGDSNAG